MDEQGGSSRFLDFIRGNKVVVVFGVLGFLLLIIGVWPYISPSKPEIEIVRSEDNEEGEENILVDVEGEVQEPGVYELPSGSRIGNALAEAGGLSANADRGWVSRYVNLASPLTDGMKIYIPAEGEEVENIIVGSGESIGVVAGSSVGLVSINTANLTELDGLWGIGQARASDIVANRPYQSIEELMTKAGIPKNVYDKIKDQVGL